MEYFSRKMSWVEWVKWVENLWKHLVKERWKCHFQIEPFQIFTETNFMRVLVLLPSDISKCHFSKICFTRKSAFTLQRNLVHGPETKILDNGFTSGNLVWLHFFKLDVLTTHIDMISCSKWSCFAENHAQVQHVFVFIFI